MAHFQKLPSDSIPALKNMFTYLSTAARQAMDVAVVVSVATCRCAESRGRNTNPRQVDEFASLLRLSERNSGVGRVGCGGRALILFIDSSSGRLIFN